MYRYWDPYDMSSLLNYKDPGTEMTAACYLPQICKGILNFLAYLVVGYEDGTIKMWNVEIGTYSIIHLHTNLVMEKITFR